MSVAKRATIAALILVTIVAAAWAANRPLRAPIALDLRQRDIDGAFDIAEAFTGKCRFDYRSQVTAIDPDTGAVRWVVDIPWTDDRDALIVADSERAVVTYVAVGKMPRGILAIGADGTPSWQADLPGDSPYAVAAAQRSVVVSSTAEAIDPLLMRIDGVTGAKVWSTAAPFTSQPGMVGDVVVIEDHELVAGFSIDDGSSLWTTDLGPASEDATAHVGLLSGVFTRSDGHELVTVAADGGVVGRLRVAGSVHRTTVVDDRLAVYESARPDRVGAFDIATGESLWEKHFDHGHPIISSDLVVGGRKLLGTQIVDVSTGRTTTEPRGTGRFVTAHVEGRSVWSVIKRGGRPSELHWIDGAGTAAMVRRLPGNGAADIEKIGDLLVVGGMGVNEADLARRPGWIAAYDEESGDPEWTAVSRDPVVRIFPFGDAVGVVTGDSSVFCD